MAREPGCKKVASNLKSLPIRFLHHFIASIIQCRTGSFVKLTTDDSWLLEMASIRTKINLARFIMKKMLKILKEKKGSSKQAKENVIVSVRGSLYNPYYTLHKILGAIAT